MALKMLKKILRGIAYALECIVALIWEYKWIILISILTTIATRILLNSLIQIPR